MALLRAVLLTALLAFGLDTAAAQAPLKVGILTELSGTLGALGGTQRDGFLLFLKTQDGKLGGRQVETIIEDTAGDPGVALAKAKRLIESNGVDVLVGPVSSATDAAIKNYVASKRIPTFVAGTVDDLTDGKYVFRTTFSNNADAFLIGYLPGKAGYKTAVAIAPNYNAGQDAIEQFAKGFAAAGGTVVQKLLPRLGTADFGSYFAQFSPEADVGIVFAVGADALRFTQQYADYGKKLPLYGYSAAVDESFLPTLGKAAEGYVGVSVYFTTIDTPENKAFLANWNAIHKDPPTWFSLSGYIAGQLLDAGLKKTNGDSSDKDALAAAIKAANIKTPAGSFRFDKNNNPIAPRYIMQIREVDGKVKPVILAVIPEVLSEPGVPNLPANLNLPYRKKTP